MDLSIIVVSWNTTTYLAQCLQSVFAHPPACDFDVWVVDNASSDSSAAMVRQEFPNVRLIENTTNVGFARANNQALRKCAGEYVLLLNSDTIVQSSALSNMAGFMQAHADAGILGANVLNPDGTLQRCFGDFPTLLTETALAWGLDSHLPCKDWLIARAIPRDGYVQTDWVLGAAMMVRRKAMNGVGLLDEDYFMYSEEVDLAYRLRRAGWKCFVLGSAHITHLGQQSTKQLVAPMKAHLYKSKLRYFRKHSGPASAAVLDLNFRASMALKAMVYRVLGFPGVSDMWLQARGCFSSNGDQRQLRLEISSPQILPDSSRDNVEAALEWILAARLATGQHGLSAGYDLFRHRWKPAYPETTGYTIPTLIECARTLGNETYLKIALDLADYELAVQTGEGAILSPGGDPLAFDTGQVIFGWLAAHAATSDDRYLLASLRAADWLASTLSADGTWREHQHLNVVKTIDTRVAWALLLVDAATRRKKYEQTARCHLDWALSQQTANGWFESCSFQPSTLPVTHTIAYTVEGLLECSLLLQEDKYFQAARKTADVLVGLQRQDGFLSGQFDSSWKPARWSCLTGDAQIALIWFRLYELTGAAKYRDAARLTVEFVQGMQNRDSTNAGIRGGIPGSAPIWGPYERLKYPNWAAKFFIDALLAERKLDQAKPQANLRSC